MQVSLGNETSFDKRTKAWFVYQNLSRSLDTWIGKIRSKKVRLWVTLIAHLTWTDNQPPTFKKCFQQVIKKKKIAT